MIHILLYSILVCFFSSNISNQSAWSKPACNGTKEFPCIVKDTQIEGHHLRNWRDTEMLANAYEGDTLGLKNIWMSGSGTPNVKDLKEIFEKIKVTTKNTVKTIIDLDLREESHGYLNGFAINLTTHDNWININKDETQILEDEKNWLESLEKNLTAYILTRTQFYLHAFSLGSYIAVNSIAAEKEIAEKIGFKYLRIPVTDHSAPSDIAVEKFVHLVQNLPDDAWVHIHCRAGKGRTTTFLAMYDMLKNADKVSFEEIIKRQGAVKPYYNLFAKSRNKKYTKNYETRLAFLEQFYDFSRERLAGNQTTFVMR